MQTQGIILHVVLCVNVMTRGNGSKKKKKTPVKLHHIKPKGSLQFPLINPQNTIVPSTTCLFCHFQK